jgi:hypothetical protein
MPLLATKDPTFDERGQRIPHRSSRAPRTVVPPTDDLSADLNRGRHDKVWWTRRFLGIDEHPGQVQFSVAATMRGPNGYSPAFLDIALASGNQAGKTLALATTVLHQTFYKLGIKPPSEETEDHARWRRTPFNWYHISYEGKVAIHVFNDIQKILTGSHPAQIDRATGEARGCPLIDEFGPIVGWDARELGEYPWIKVHPAFGGGEIHFRHTNEKAKSLLGLAMNGISYDEAAFELYLAEIRAEVLHLRRITTGGPIYWISTGTEGYNAFADVWEEGNRANPRRNPRALSLRMSTRDNIGYGITQEGFDSLVSSMDPRLVPQNIDGEFIEAVNSYFHAETVEALFHKCPEGECSDHVPDFAPPVKDHRYAQGVDPAISHDATGALVLDYTQKPWTGVRLGKRAGRQPLPAVVDLVRSGHLLYNQDGARCTTLIDSTGIGGKLFKQEFSIIRPLREFDFAGLKSRKLELLSDLKAAIDRRDLVLPSDGHWREVRRQLLGYKLDDKKLDTDLLMALALAVRHATRNPSAGMAAVDFDFYANQGI